MPFKIIITIYRIILTSIWIYIFIKIGIVPISFWKKGIDIYNLMLWEYLRGANIATYQFIIMLFMMHAAFAQLYCVTILILKEKHPKLRIFVIPFYWEFDFFWVFILFVINCLLGYILGVFCVLPLPSNYDILLTPKLAYWLEYLPFSTYIIVPLLEIFLINILIVFLDKFNIFLKSLNINVRWIYILIKKIDAMLNWLESFDDS